MPTLVGLHSNSLEPDCAVYGADHVQMAPSSWRMNDHSPRLDYMTRAVLSMAHSPDPERRCCTSLENDFGYECNWMLSVYTLAIVGSGSLSRCRVMTCGYSYFIRLLHSRKWDESTFKDTL